MAVEAVEIVKCEECLLEDDFGRCMMVLDRGEVRRDVKGGPEDSIMGCTGGHVKPEVKHGREKLAGVSF